MNAIVIDTNDDIIIDARLVADGFGLSEGKVRDLMRTGAITARCETGEGLDAGKMRLNFLFGNRVLRLTIDSTGNLLSPARIEFVNGEFSAARNFGADASQVTSK